MELGNPEEAKKKKKANQTRANSDDAHACMHAPELSISSRSSTFQHRQASAHDTIRGNKDNAPVLPQRFYACSTVCSCMVPPVHSTSRFFYLFFLRILKIKIVNCRTNLHAGRTEGPRRAHIIIMLDPWPIPQLQSPPIVWPLVKSRRSRAQGCMRMHARETHQHLLVV
jgi:hypothetical protein